MEIHTLIYLFFQQKMRNIIYLIEECQKGAKCKSDNDFSIIEKCVCPTPPSNQCWCILIISKAENIQRKL